MGLRYERAVRVSAAADQVFARLDDQTRLAAHMERSSAMMGGGRMTYEFDAGLGQAVGSHIKMGGSAFGIPLFVDEVITERAPPYRKAWRTEEPVRLLILRGYRMGFDLAPDAGDESELKVWIDYDLPPGLLGWLVRPLTALYARWCVGRMADDAVKHFATQGPERDLSTARTRPL